MRIPLGLLCLTVAVSSRAAVTGVSVSVTNTQAVIQYTVPDSQPCKVQVSEVADFSVPVNDTDTKKFPDSDVDTRAGSLQDGTQRTFVAGKRVAERGSDHVFYSRALQALTKHFYRIACGADTQSGEFTTANLLMGNTYTEPQPVDPLQPGEYAWPTLSYSDRKQRVVDPQTGLLIRHVSLPGDRVITAPNQSQPFQFARSATWKDPAGALSRVGGGAGASIGGNNTGTLLLTAQNNEYAGYISFFKGGHGINQYTLNWFQVVLTAATDSAACDTAGSDDCKLTVCLTINGVACYAGARQFDLALNTKQSRFTLGKAGQAIDLWQAAGARPPNGAEIATRTGKVNCDGSANVVWAEGNPFATHWSAGSTITIDKQDFTIAHVQDTAHLTITGSCSPGRGRTFAATNFGVLFRKKTASANHVSVNSSTVSYQMGVFPSWDYTGAFDLCAAEPVKGANGRPGYNCVLPESGMIYRIDAESGESHLFARYMSNGKPVTNGCGNSDSQIFDSLNPDIWYCGGSTAAGAEQNPYRVHYFGNHLEPDNTQSPGHFEEGENLPECLGMTTPRNQPCLQYSPITEGADLLTLTTAFDPQFQKDRFRHFFLVGLENGVMVFRVWRGAHSSIGWTVVFDPNATKNGEAANAGCVGGGKPGCVIAAMPSWSRKGARWCALKGNDPMSQPGWLSISAYIWGAPGDTAPGVGPYQADVVEGSRFTKTLTACPANIFKVTGDRCTTVKVSGEPRDASPCTANLNDCGGALESGAPGELQTAEVGDEFTAGPAGSDEEVMRLIAKEGRTWTFERAVNGNVTERPPNTPAFAFCAANPDPKNRVGNLEVYWNYLGDPHGRNTDGKTILGDRYGVNAHFFMQNGVKATGYTEDKRCSGADKHFCYQVSTFQSIPQYVSAPPTGIATQDPSFAGKSAPAFPNQLQQHPSGPGIHASVEDRHYFFDARPFNGSPLSGSVGTEGAHPATVIAANFYKFTAVQTGTLDRKYLPTFAFAGSKPLLDVSGPQSKLTGDAADSYRYCVALIAGECQPASAPGDVFVNAPFVTKPYCSHPGQASGLPDEYDLCIGNNAMVYNSIMQIGAEGIDNTGAHQRMISKGLGRNRLLTPFWHSHSLANGRWALVKTEYINGVADMILAVHVPPPPAADNIDRSTFVPVMVKLQPPAGISADNAYVEFGYGEYSSTGHRYCTSRAEECAAFSTTVKTATPFLFAATEAARLSGTACATGCTIAVPAVSQRVLYTRGVFRDAKKNVVAKGPVSAVVTP